MEATSGPSAIIGGKGFGLRAGLVGVTLALMAAGCQPSARDMHLRAREAIFYPRAGDGLARVLPNHPIPGLLDTGYAASRTAGLASAAEPRH